MKIQAFISKIENTINRGKHKMADKKLGFAEVTTNARNA